MIPLFPKERTDYIAKLLKDYYEHPNRTIAEARDIVHHEQGMPSPVPKGNKFKRMKPPTLERMDEIEIRDKWRGVFVELEEWCAQDKDTEDVLRYTFREKYIDDEVCRIVKISRSLFYDCRIKILNRAVVYAIRDKIIEIY